ncbi:MAG: sigma-70 family RNA polymerase sigma factor [Clostridia bacterium]|nr:sigma-70 family RNA polymerase sigma factor [Clostridia bacterium]
MRVFSFVMTQCGDRVLSEEVTQETFYRAFTHRRDFRGASDEVTWLCAIARNLLTDERRHLARRGGDLQDVPDASGDPEGALEKAFERKDSSFQIHLALHALEEPYREVFELRVFGELSFREIGEIFQKTENWARVTYHRAKIRLQDRLKKDGTEHENGL